MVSDIPLSTSLTAYPDPVQDSGYSLTMGNRQLRRVERVLARKEGNKICVSAYGTGSVRE